MKELEREWGLYISDPKVVYNPDPPLGVVFSFEGFWMWLKEKYKYE